MKKVFAICLALVMVLSLSINVMAASNFVSSPSNNPAPEIVDYENESDECTAVLTIIPYSERDSLTDEERAEMQDVYERVLSADNLADMFSDLKGLLTSGMQETDLAVSDVFHINFSGCENHQDHGKFKIKLSDDTLNGFLGLIQMVNGEWVLIADANVEGEYLTFSADELSTFAIVVDRTKAESTSPITGDPTANYILAAAVFAGLCLTMVVTASKKKA